MKKGTIIVFVVLIIIIIAGVTGFVLWKKKTPTNSINDTQVLYIEAKDAETGEIIKANYMVVINNTLYAVGETNLKGKEEVKVPLIPGKNIYVLAYNDDYYVQRTVYTGYTVDVELYKKGKIELISVVPLSNKSFNITAKAIGGQYRQYGFCIRWSMSFLDVWSNQFIQGEYINSREKCEGIGLQWQLINETGKCQLEYINVFPTRMTNLVDKCYYTLQTFAEDEELTFTLHYDILYELGEFDEIDLIFFDSDRNFLNKYTVEGSTQEDVGAPDYKFILTADCLEGGECQYDVCESYYCSF